MHIAEELLQRLADQEAGAEAAGVRAHLDGCEACAGRLSGLLHEDREIEALLRALDHPVPAASAQAVRGRAALGGRRPRRALLAAALAMLVLGGGAAAAMSSAAVRGLVRRVWHAAVAGSAAPARPRLPVAAPAGAPTLGTGIAFAPGRRVVIEFTTAQAAGTIEIRTTSDSLVHIDPVGGRASFAVTSSGVRVDNAGGAASYRITLPAGLAEAQVRVAGRVVAEQRNGRLSAVPGGGGRTRLVVPLDRH